MRALTIAIGNYGITAPLKDGSVATGRLELQHIAVEPIIAGMRRMVRGLEFDICEMAFTTYLCAKAMGKPLTAIPVFLTRGFHHRAAVCRAGAGIATPKDLEGRRVGVNRGYTVTTGLWARGILASEFGLALDKVTWLPTDDEHVAEFQAPANVDYALRGRNIVELLRSGQLDAAVGDIRSDSPEIKPLIANPREAGFASFRRTGVYPVNHGVVIQNAVLAEAPWVAEELFRAFAAAKSVYLRRLAERRDLTPDDTAALGLQEVVGDPFPFGVAANRKAIETLVQYAQDQHVIPRRYGIEELFAPNTLAVA